jgi:hypothetical protein
LERQDIDALLVGALYGELSSTEQAQLTAHLESHPADRSALDDLKAVRERFTTSRIFDVQLDPPQAVSALLLQEAARRAPKQVVAPDKNESWFDRFVRSFIAHPAMAAAATLVLVVGVAGTIYLKGNGEMAQPRVAQEPSLLAPGAANHEGEAAWGSATMGAMDPAVRAQTKASEPAPVVAMTPPAPTDQGAAGSTGAGDFKRDSVAVGLAEDKIAKTGSAPHQAVAHDRERSDALAFADDGKQEVAKHATAPAKAPKGRYVEVPKDSPQPKELEQEHQDLSGKDAYAKNDRKEATRGAGPSGGAAGGGGYATATTTATAPTAPPTANAAPAPTVAAAPPPPPPQAGEAPATKVAQKPDSSLAWAKDQHAKIIALVKDGKCSAAVPLAATLKTRAPDYYATNVATDRSLKSCMQYVNDSTTERAAEKRASKATDSK